jgi:hypothetical protein
MKTYSKELSRKLLLKFLVPVTGIILLFSFPAKLCTATVPILPENPFLETPYNDKSPIPNPIPQEDKPLFMLFHDLGIEFTPEKTRIVISKKEHILMIFSEDDFIKMYPVELSAYGMNDKVKEKDYLTPEGVFYLAMRYDSPTYRSYYGFMGLSYPTTEDAIRGLKQKMINDDTAAEIISKVHARKTDYNKGSDWMGNGLWSGRVGLGGVVGIHGEENPGDENDDPNFAQLGGYYRQREKRRVDWTEGCIALSNNAVDEIRYLTGSEDWVKYTTPVLIVKSLSEISSGALSERFELFLQNPKPFVDTGTLEDLEIPEGLKQKLTKNNLLDGIEASVNFIKSIPLKDNY